MESPKVFISYSHKDEAWKNQLLTHLHLFEKQGVMEIWDSGEIQVGSNWSQQIENQIKSADIAVLLVSADFLASDYIIEKELPALFSRRQKEGMAILPIVVRPSAWSGVPELAQLQFLNTDARPLSTVSGNEADKAIAQIAGRIREIATAISERKVTKNKTKQAKKKSTKQTPKELFGEFFISHSKKDGDFAELLKLKLESEGHKGWIDIDRLSPGVDWRTGIDDAIRSCTGIIAVMSPDGRKSEYVTYEWAFAWGSGKRIIPIMLHQTSLHPRLATLQFLDFTTRESRPWTNLFETLNGLANTEKECS